MRVSDELYAEWKRWCVSHAALDESADFQLGIAQDFDDTRAALKVATEALEDISTYVSQLIAHVDARIRGEGERDE